MPWVLGRVLKPKKLTMILVRMVVLGLAIFVASTVSAEDKKPEKLDPAKLIGGWKLSAGLKAGEKYEDTMNGTTDVTKDQITVADDRATFVFGYKIDTSKTPVEIDMEILSPDDLKGNKAKGIIKLEDGKTTLCYHPMGGERPTKFESTADNSFFLFTYKKVEKK